MKWIEVVHIFSIQNHQKCTVIHLVFPVYIDNNLRSDQGEGGDGDANVRIELGASNQRECNIGDEGNINDTASCSASIQNDDISQDGKSC